MSFSVVLGSGGLIGVAWETGIAAGLLEGGIDLRTADAIVGTSAGSIVGTQLAAGRIPAAPAASAGREAGATPLVDPTKLDMQALGKIFQRWGGMQTATTEQLMAVGQVARGLQRAGEQAWVDSIAATVGVTQWPQMRLMIAVVDTATGLRKFFDRSSGAPVARVVAASSAVPGLFPSVEIDGCLYMDGGVYSATHADALLEHKPARVLVANPTNTLTSRGIGALAERMLEREVQVLREAGIEVLVRTPSAEDVTRFGGNLMDAARTPEAYAVGFTTGRAWASELR